MAEWITQRTDKQAAIINGKWSDIQLEAAKHNRSKITVEDYSEEKEITTRQINWWKGVLLPALSKDNGDSVSKWETRLKMAVLPEEFQPEIVEVNGYALNCVPSIKKLSCKKTIQLVEGSVDKLHDWGEALRKNNPDEYGNVSPYAWVELPDSAKRKRS